MSVAKSSSGGTGFVSDDSLDGSLHPIHGVAIGSNDITVGHKSGKRKLWTPEVLSNSASTLAGKEIVVDHENRDSREVVGEVEEAMFKDGVGVIYKGVIDDDELATKIGHGWLEVSPRIIHSKEMEERDGLYIPKSVRKFDNLSIVVRGASPSNSVNLGEPEELMSVEELQSAFGSDDSVVEEYQEFEGQVNMKKYLFPTQEGALGAAQALGCSGSHTHEFEGETMYMPCDSHDQFLKSFSETQENESCGSCNDSVEELVISEAREPQYDETEEKPWGEIPASTLSYYTENLGYDVEQWDDLTQEQKQEIVDHTLLGDPDADTADNGIFFPVVNAATGDLNRGALEAVRSGRGQSADIPEETYQSVFRIAGRLLNEEFGSDVEVEMTATSLYESVIIEELQEDLDEVYSDWSDAVNMTASELRRWSGNPCSREASVDPEAVIERNLNLLETNKGDWGEEEIEDANRTISFVNRMKPNAPDGDASDGTNGCPTDWAISLLNWAYNPFDDLPEQPDDEDLEDVEELETLGIEKGNMVEWRVLPAMGKVVAIDDERSVAMVSIYKNGEDTDIAVTAGFEDIIPMEIEEMAKHSEEMSGHSKEEMQTASQMASQTKMTKKEALKFLSGLNPMRNTDARGMGEMLAKAMKADEMEKMMDEMSKHMESEMGSDSGSSDDGGSMLNSIIN